ncbi:hypothetical protein Gasu2_20110 [Galdieria sulphuraria]|nr:hypothetical protein Gasu2_20110 [Galdieria sulphuraria]
MDCESHNKLEELEYYLYCIFHKELERIKEGALQQLESRGWFEEQSRQRGDILWDSILQMIDSGAEQFPQDIKDSLFLEVLGLLRIFAKEFRKWKLEEQLVILTEASLSFG